MRNIYLVARRDYLGYVTSWGFWLGILLLPLIIGGSAIVPRLIVENQPTRYYTVIEQGTEYRDLIADVLEDRRIGDVRRQLRTLTQDPPEGFRVESFEAFQDAVIGGASLQEALDGIDTGVTLDIPSTDWVYVEPPTTDPDELNAYLLEQRMLDGDRSLFAAVVQTEVPSPDGSMVPALVYQSANVTNRGLVTAVEAAARDAGRIRVYEAAGITSREVEAAAQTSLQVIPVKLGVSGESATASIADMAPFFAAAAIVFVLWFMVFSMVQYLLAGTIEERGNKIFDTLLTSTNLRQLLIGKLLAVFGLTLTLMGSWAFLAFAISSALNLELPAVFGSVLSAMGQTALQPQVLIPTLISFVLGYLIYGALFLALGSLCETVQESQTLISPLLILLMIPLFMLVMAIEDPGSQILALMSWFPFFTPFLLILRLPNELPLWEVSALILLMLVTTALILWAAMRVYRAGAVNGAGVDSVGRWFQSLIPGMKAKSKP